MDSNKIMFGRLLGEIYRIQKRIDIDMCAVDDSRIYGLIEGIEEAIDEELSNNVITGEDLEIVANILNNYFDNGEKEESFTGYYQIEPELERKSISRHKASKIITYFKSQGRFVSLIEKMNSTASPTECKKFNIPNWAK